MGLDSRDNEISGEDDAAVEVLDLMPQIEVIKSASPTSVVEGSNTPVTFTVEVVNTSPADSVTLVSLTDDIYGELVNCPLPATIPVGESYVCSFTVVVDGPANSIETDTVTAVGMDDEGNPAIASDSATVTVLDDPATIELIKVANPTEVNEPGDDVTYTFTVQNLSSVDAVTITTLDDDIWGSLNDLGDCGLPQVMPPLGSYTCTVTMAVLGNAHDVVTNVATASGVDDDGKVLFASDSATVNILDVPPAASLTKVVTKAIVTYHVTVSNDSPSEVLELESLWDDQFGAITQVAGDIVHTTCMVPQTIAVGGSYACSFDAFVVTSPHVDIVTGTLWDDEGSPVSPSDSATVTLDTVP